MSDDCLRCRFLTTSSVERTVGPWCEAAPPDVVRAPEQPAIVPPPRPPVPCRPHPLSPLDLPILVPVGPGIRVADPAVRPAAPVPSGQPIGT